jgi:AraC-like DNA-binding protein
MIHLFPVSAPAAPGGSSDPRSPDTVLFESADVRVGAFRCPADHPDFRTAGPIGGYSVVFPRTAVWIQHPDQRPFVADPTVAAIYNLGQPYQRFRLSTEGDRADWFSVSSRLARAIMGGIDRGADPLRPFGVSLGPVPARLYYRQRLMFSRIASGRLRDPFEVEQEVTELLGSILELAIPGPRVSEPATAVRQRVVVERARAELAANPFGRSTVRTIAARVGVSPYHLCRLFRRHTGHTLHHYRLELRARLAIERLEVSDTSLSRVAHGIGFSSHSHFTAAFRQRVGLTPSGVRRALQRHRVPQT